MTWIWMIIAGSGALLFLIGLGRAVGGLRPDPDMRGLPSTPVERLAWVGLVTSGSVGIALITLVALEGADGFDQEGGGVGTIFNLVIFAALGVWLIAWQRTNRREGGRVVDERDREVLARSFSVESMLVFTSLVAWTIALTEVFRDEGSIPLAYLQLLFWSTFLIGIFGRSMGIILGYRRNTTDA